MKQRSLYSALIVGTALFHLVHAPVMGAGAVSSLSPPGREQQAHTEWVGKVYDRMLAIKPGMTRAQLLEVFEHDGGLSTRLQGRYVSRDCLYFKVDVEFEAVGQPPRGDSTVVMSIEANTDRITRISKPYLEPRHAG